MMTRILAPLTLVLVMFASPLLAQTINLRPNWKEGETVAFNMKTSSTLNMRANQVGLDTKQVTKQDIGMTLRVLQVRPEGGAEVELTFDHVAVEIEQVAGTAKYDSRNPDPTSPLSMPLSPLLTMKLKLTFDSDGRLTMIRGNDAAQSGVGGQILLSIAGTETIGRRVGFLTSPRRGVSTAKVGDSWTTDDTLSGDAFGEMKMVMTHTVKSFNDPMADIDIEGTLEIVSDQSSNPLTIEKADIDGAYDWDSELGMLKHLETTQDLLITGAVRGTDATVTTKQVTVINRVND